MDIETVMNDKLYENWFYDENKNGSHTIIYINKEDKVVVKKWKDEHRSFNKESNFYRNIQNSNIQVVPKFYCHHENPNAIVIEYIEGLTISEMYKTKKVKKEIIIEKVYKALSELFEHNCCYLLCELKDEHFIFRNGNINELKIIDFGEFDETKYAKLNKNDIEIQVMEILKYK